jgi:AGCS family alanine or glycine:cation symporter
LRKFGYIMKSTIGATLKNSMVNGEGTITPFHAVTTALASTVGTGNIVGVATAIAIGVVILDGIKRIGRFSERMVPFMVTIYILGALAVLVVNVTAIPHAFVLIFKGAFTTLSVAGGVTGYLVITAVRLGVSRGLYSNEAGLGSASIAHAAAITDHPSMQGMWGSFEVFADTIIVCTLTALTIIVSGVYTSGESATILTATAFGTIIPAAKYFVGLSLILFAFTTIIGVGYYGEIHSYCWLGMRASKIYLYIYLVGIFIGCIGAFSVIWGVFDVLMALNIIPNLVGILLLSPLIFKRTREFFDSPGGIIPAWKPELKTIDRSVTQ